MPELPEVHALVADLGSRLIGHAVKRLDIVSFVALKTFDPPVAALDGRTVRAVSQHGKFLDLEFDSSNDAPIHLVFHLARAGWIRWRAAAPAVAKRPGAGPIAARLIMLGDDELPAGSGLDITEAGTKKSLALWIVRSAWEVPRVATLGPDPLGPSFTAHALGRILATKGRAQIKGVLRDQSTIAGIGNAYSDEILHAAKMSPFKPAAMSQDDVATLFDAMQSTLGSAIARADGLAASELKAEKKSNLQVHGRTGLPCPVCGDTVRQVIYADSTFQYCPTCQTGGKPLADRVLSRLLK